MSLFDHIPVFRIEDAEYLAKEFYGLHVQATPLPSERDQNFLLQAHNGDQFVLKIANGTEERAILEAQNQVMRHLANFIQFCPQVIAALSGEEIVAVESISSKPHFIRLVTYLIGTPFGNVKRHSPELLQDRSDNPVSAKFRSSCISSRLSLGPSQRTYHHPKL